MVTVYYKTKKPRIHFLGLSESSANFNKAATLRHNTRTRSWQPATDIYETDENIVIIIELAGIRENDLTITADQNTLLIQGIRQPPYESPRSIHQMEVLYGDFGVELLFSIPIETERIEAIYDQGFLRITLPKSQPRIIPIIKD
ncbi:MAG: Hsp20/alpha crystallin family protein [Bellilinea sp.]|jgi:HSP20 family protein